MSSPPSVRRLAVIGDPIAHSLSPLLQRHLIEHFGLPFRYEALRVTAAQLPGLVARLRNGELAGVNVTLPHKQAMVPLLDDLVAPAHRIAAVNTVVCERGLLLGHNTDVPGFARSLQAAGIAVRQETVLLLGAGGAAAAVLLALLEAGVDLIYISNRDASRPQRLLARLSPAGQAKVRLISWPQRLELLQLPAVTLVINATSAGMWPRVEISPVPADLLHAGLTVVDLVYNPVTTRLLREAHAAGARTLSGLPMLIYQGVAALELWSGQCLDITDLVPELEQKLQAALTGKS
ncbi:MAG: shikimate dehydrogenase [candidate division KSB1 bacterium]|nr:shikimate dehydrogenase [candidate division KSB1 bacterium]MDZ7288290.1 shikimate dehydrogenase [candidate division KSB1 bacterium]MDZ7300486.1 shikimate dehydrogenase [candidate division KSB1 bacterium]MDZ7308067.1 shikimate dehydrogenase [candidate division KSB1 bacterium]MDZ7351484.1 shikimate dehydrogenase [candidate division KSB1 bacterium]